MAGITLPAVLWALPEEAALPAAVSRPAGAGADGLPLRPAEAGGLLELELELELLCEDGEGMEGDELDEDDELDGIDGMALCDDCC